MAGGKIKMPGSMEYVVDDDPSLLFRFAGWLDRILDGRLINRNAPGCGGDE